jgi:hypothetical protein
MASGTPVAAFPVDGPLEVLGQADGRASGGAMDLDLKQAWLRALSVPRHEARARALNFSWVRASRQFLVHLVPARRGVVLDRPPQTNEVVTRLS